MHHAASGGGAVSHPRRSAWCKRTPGTDLTSWDAREERVMRMKLWGLGCHGARAVRTWTLTCLLPSAASCSPAFPFFSERERVWKAAAGQHV